MRTDRGAYGTFLGVAVPFEWVNDSSIRIGFEVAVGRTFGGDVRAQCRSGGFSAVDSCVQGEIRDFDRPAGGGLYSHFQFGFGFNRPGPLPKQ
jgi:hypothetical protein